ncbi:hypothetical protein [Thermoanaerobacterium sp. DL9XJH110]|uniref:hypothetical protein n=1 Tax=Thermoanaerobacterium sp. DL9XJH110 TaxID=3386643 RepID=UPI003BB59391
MYWEFNGQEFNEQSCRDSIICKLGNFLISKPDFFYFVGDVLITCKKHNPNNQYYDAEKIKLKLAQIVLADNSIKRAEVKYFYSLFNEYLNNNKIKKGELLDYIIYKIGPFNIVADNVIKKRNCKINIENKLHSEKDFDVVFYSYNSNEILSAEIIECKLDLMTFIHNPPSNKYSFSRNAEEKLELMKLIKLNKRENDIILFYLATLRKNIESCNEILRNKGFDFIEILNGDSLNMLLKMFVKTRNL